MRHPTEGTLRRLLDEPAGVADTDREHVEGCESCGSSLHDMRDDAAIVHAALATDADGVDLDAAWQRLTAAASSSDASTVTTMPRRRRVRSALRRPVVAATVVAVVVTGAGAAAANDWLPIFRTERVEPVSISAGDLNALPDLSAYGDVEIIATPDVHPVADAAAAEAETGLEVPEVAALPRGVSGEPMYQVGGEASATFTFDAERAAQAAADAGEELPPPPPGLDGSQVRFVAGPGVSVRWSSDAGSGMPALVVGRAIAPTAYSSSDVSFETMRDYLLSIPGLPEDVAEPLRTFNADDATLPLPVPAERITTSSAIVDGRPATVIATPDRTLAAVVWVDDGVLTIVAGALDTDEVLSVAQDLR